MKRALRIRAKIGPSGDVAHKCSVASGKQSTNLVSVQHAFPYVDLTHAADHGLGSDETATDDVLILSDDDHTAAVNRAARLQSSTRRLHLAAFVQTPRAARRRPRHDDVMPLSVVHGDVAECSIVVHVNNETGVVLNRERVAKRRRRRVRNDSAATGVRRPNPKRHRRRCHVGHRRRRATKRRVGLHADRQVESRRKERVARRTSVSRRAVAFK